MCGAVRCGEVRYSRCVLCIGRLSLVSHSSLHVFEATNR